MRRSRDHDGERQGARPASLVGRLLSERVRRWLASPRAVRWIVAISVLAAAPSLGLGLLLDDHAHRLLVEGDGTIWQGHAHPLDFFRFLDGDPSNMRHAVEVGTMPWFAQPSLKLAFFRPVAGLTHYFDYTALADAPWLMHMHSLLWFALFGLATARLIRRLETGWAAGLILLFFVMDPSHGIPAAWLANRNPLIAGVFGALALAAHVKGRQDGRAWGSPWTLLWFGLGLLSAESMLGWLGFFLAYAVVLDPAGLRRGLLSLLPTVGIIAVWRVVYTALGYGTAHSGLYIDPLSDPARFAAATVERLPQLLAAPLGGPPPGVGALLSETVETALIAIAAVVITASVVVGWRTLKHDAHARFWALGAVLAAIPFCATFPASRLMVIASLGTAGFMARVVAHVAESKRPWFAERWGAMAWLVLAGFLGPLRLAAETQSVKSLAHPAELAANSAPDAAPDQTLVVVAIPDPMFMCGHIPLARASKGERLHARQRCLAPLEGSGQVHRVDAHTLDITVPDGLLEAFFVSLLRDPEEPLPEDWRFELSDVSFTIAERDNEGRPTTVRARFQEPLESEAYQFVIWNPTEDRLVEFALPAVGETVAIEGEPVIDIILAGG